MVKRLFNYGSALADRSKGMLYISSLMVMTGGTTTHLKLYLSRHYITFLTLRTSPCSHQTA
jgi:hypothetical protein